MKREGRQHGMVRTHCILQSTTLSTTSTSFPRKANTLISVSPAAGVFIGVPSKPTNHSKFTGKCRLRGCSSCHLLPSSKSKDKTKGSSKLRSSHAHLGSDLRVVLDELHDYTHLGSYRRNQDEDDDEEEVECGDNGGCDLDERPRRSNVYLNEDDDDVAFSWDLLDGVEFEGWSFVGEV